MKQLCIPAILILLTACTGGDQRFGDEVERVTRTLDLHQEATLGSEGLAQQDLLDFGEQALQSLNNIQIEEQGSSDQAGVAAVRYLGAARAFILAANRMQRAIADLHEIDQGAPPSNELALAFHSENKARLRAAQARATAYAKRIQEGLNETRTARALMREARAELIASRDALAAFIPAEKLISQDYAAVADQLTSNEQ